ncbi:MAG: MFS transporter, partial [Anaerolineae bacterium]|nr:MFS transporter [Anaerolineae bacterium]
SALMADSLAPQDRGRGVAIMSALSGAPAILAPFVAGAFLDRVGVDPGMRWLYGVLMIAYMISGLLSLRYLKEASPETERRFDLADIKRTLKESYLGIPGLWRQLSPSLRAMAIMLTLVFVSSAVAGPFWVVYAVDHIGLSKVQWGSILMLETGLRNLVLIPAGAIIDRHGRTRWILASLALSLVSLPLFVYARGFAAVLGLRLAAAVSSAFFLPACTALLADLVPRTIRGRVMAAMGSGSVPLGFASGSPGGPGLGFVVVLPLMAASLSAGYLYARNPASPWYVASGAVAISLMLVAAFVRDARQAEV